MKKITIVAEIGVNHNGNVRLAKKMIKEAIKCGADIVKFQTFFAEEFVKSNTKKAKYQLLSTNKKESHYDHNYCSKSSNGNIICNIKINTSN